LLHVTYLTVLNMILLES